MLARAADRRARPGRPRLGLAARQPLPLRPAAARAARRARRRNGPAGRRGPGRGSGRGPPPSPAALRLKWPNDLLLRRRQMRRHPGRERRWRPDGRHGLADRSASGSTWPHAPGAAGPADRLPRRRRGRRRPSPPRCSRGCRPLARPCRRAAGFAPVRAAWIAARPGTRASADAARGGRRPAGHFAGLAEDGGLLLDIAGAGAAIIRAGDDRWRSRRRPEAMLLAIDAGNTNVVFAVHDGTEWRGRWRIATRAGPDLGRIRRLAAGAAAALPA